MTPADLTCPKCGAHVEPHRVASTAVGIGDPGTGEINLQPWREHARCPGCESQLFLLRDHPEFGWQLDQGPPFETGTGVDGLD